MAMASNASELGSGTETKISGAATAGNVNKNVVAISSTLIILILHLEKIGFDFKVHIQYQRN